MLIIILQVDFNNKLKLIITIIINQINVNSLQFYFKKKLMI